jgi:hypothetical protein
MRGIAMAAAGIQAGRAGRARRLTASGPRRAAAALSAALMLAALTGAARQPAASDPVQAAFTPTGPYVTATAAVTNASGTAIYDLFYPGDYAALGFQSPIVTWGNGTGGTPADYSVFLQHLASYGFTVIASTRPDTGSGNEIDAAARYLAAQDSVPASVFYGHLNVTEVAAAGLSQGATGAVRATTNDPALIKTVLTFSEPNPIWAAPNPDCPTAADCTAHPAALTRPVFFISTHGFWDSIIASPATQKAFFLSTSVHAALGVILTSDAKPADHTSIQNPALGGNPGGFLGYATAWLEYQLRGNAAAAAAFTGAHPELVSNTNWPGSAAK